MGLLSARIVGSNKTGKSKPVEEGTIRPVRSAVPASGQHRSGTRPAFNAAQQVDEESGRGASIGSASSYDDDSDDEVDLEDEDSNSLAARLKVAMEAILRGDMAGLSRALAAVEETNEAIDDVYMNDLLTSLFTQASDPQVTHAGSRR